MIEDIKSPSISDGDFSITSGQPEIVRVSHCRPENYRRYDVLLKLGFFGGSTAKSSVYAGQGKGILLVSLESQSLYLNIRELCAVVFFIFFSGRRPPEPPPLSRLRNTLNISIFYFFFSAGGDPPNPPFLGYAIHLTSLFFFNFFLCGGRPPEPPLSRLRNTLNMFFNFFSPGGDPPDPPFKATQSMGYSFNVVTWRGLLRSQVGLW